MYRLVLLKFTVLWKPLTMPLFASPRAVFLPPPPPPFPPPPPPFTPLARQTNNTNLKNDDSDDENFTAKMYSRSFQT